MGKYALVLWINSNSTSVVPSSPDQNNELFINPFKSGKVAYPQKGQKEPAGGWEKHDARVICTDGEFCSVFVLFYFYSKAYTM